MINLIKRYLVWRDRHTRKYIGKVPFTLNMEDKRKVPMSILLYMSESGRRSVEWPNSDYDLKETLAQYEVGQVVIEWLKGGEFPQAFIPVPDTLGPMLMRIVDIRLGLKGEE